jgi:hypothetical protein
MFEYSIVLRIFPKECQPKYASLFRASLWVGTNRKIFRRKAGADEICGIYMQGCRVHVAGKMKEEVLTNGFPTLTIYL